VIVIAVGVWLNVDDEEEEEEDEEEEEEEQTKEVKQGNSAAEGGTCIALAFYIFVPLRV
jgi:riboflavin synthase alpha subunit